MTLGAAARGAGFGAARPLASKNAPVPASARSITSTAATSPVRGRGGSGSETDASGTRRIGAGAGTGVAAGAGDGRAGPGGICGGAYEIGPPAAYGAAASAACAGSGASSGILAVGATRGSETSFAPHRPQKRESGVFSVLHAGQRIPMQAYLKRTDLSSGAVLL